MWAPENCLGYDLSVRPESLAVEGRQGIFWCREGANAAAMQGHRGKFATLPAPKSPAGPTRQTFRTDT